MSELTAGNIVVTRVTEAEESGWKDFVSRQKHATFFHDLRWKRVIESGLGHRTHYLIAKQREDIVGVLPLAEVRSRLFGHRLVSNPCCVYGGPLAETADAESALLTEARKLAVLLGVNALEIRPLPGDAGESCYAPEEWHTKDLYVTFRKPIFEDRDKNLSSIPRKQRAMVRKGIASGLHSGVTNDVRRFYRIYAESVRNLGTPVFSLRYFKALCNAFPDSVELAMVMHNGLDIATVMSFYFRDEVLPYYGGSRRVARDLKGNDFMYWDLMSRAAERGCRLFDFGRSKRGTGSFSFKKNWGFVATPLPYRYDLVVCEKVPDVNPTNPKYQLLIAGWKMMPLPLANAVGPLLARHLG